MEIRSPARRSGLIVDGGCVSWRSTTDAGRRRCSATAHQANYVALQCPVICLHCGDPAVQLSLILSVATARRSMKWVSKVRYQAQHCIHRRIGKEQGYSEAQCDVLLATAFRRHRAIDRPRANASRRSSERWRLFLFATVPQKCLATDASMNASWFQKLPQAQMRVTSAHEVMLLMDRTAMQGRLNTRRVFLDLRPQQDPPPAKTMAPRTRAHSRSSPEGRLLRHLYVWAARLTALRRRPARFCAGRRRATQMSRRGRPGQQKSYDL